ncbi:hypothetical protein [Tenacibaculum xiamenense]|uniref:hypothetical protein n=1 Tax=Tenacibaculum xiamenense TaxID=1261553 RepID=UPI003893315E
MITKKLSIVFILLVLIGCSNQEDLLQQDINGNETSLKSNVLNKQFSTLNIQQKNGMLTFDNLDDFLNSIQFFSNMSGKERITWARDNNFKTQKIILDELDVAQNQFEMDMYRNLPEDISIDEMKKLGYKPQLCDDIKKHVRSGLLSKTIEKDGGLSYELKVKNGSQYVININGEVEIGGEVFDFSNTNTLAKSSWNLVYSFEKGNIFGDFPSVIWYYNSSKQRFKHVYGAQLYERMVGGERKILHLFYTESIAHKKQFGVWKTRYNYKPIKSISGTWDWAVLNPIYVGSEIGEKPSFSTGLNSGFHREYGNENEVFEFLYPTGECAESVDNYDTVNFFSGHIRGVFWGGPSGYSTNYYFGH